MLENDNKLARTRKEGFKRIVKKDQKKEKLKSDSFNPDAQKNWLFPDDLDYCKKRRSKKKKK